MSSTHRHQLLDFFWQVISGPPCIHTVVEKQLNAKKSIYIIMTSENVILVIVNTKKLFIVNTKKLFFLLL
jgi:hypothetical protein